MLPCNESKLYIILVNGEGLATRTGIDYPRDYHVCMKRSYGFVTSNDFA